MHHFTGKERDTESGNDYFGARYYASSMGRWESPDLLNVTEERMLNPSSTLNKYAYGANNPLKFIDQDGQDITVFYDHSGNAGHAVLFAYNQDTQESAVHSFGPDHSQSNAAETALDIPVPGQENYDLPKTPDQLRSQYTSITIQTSPEVTQQVINIINSTNAKGDGKYTTEWNNCTTTCTTILRQLHLYSGRPLIPRDFFFDLYSKNGNKQTPTHSGWNKFNNGVDYGRPRVGYNAFDLLGLMQCHTETVSVTINGQTTSSSKTRCQN
jgi:RHS repeat-associated protein